MITDGPYDPGTVAHAKPIIKKVRREFGKTAAPCLAAAYELALHYWSYQPYMLIFEKRQIPLLVNCAMQFAVAQSGVGENWEEHAQAILDSAKDQFDAETQEAD